MLQIEENLYYATLLYDFDRWDNFVGFEDFGDVSEFDWQQDLRGHGGPIWGLPSDEGVARGGYEAYSRGPFLQHKVLYILNEFWYLIIIFLTVENDARSL